MTNAIDIARRPTQPRGPHRSYRTIASRDAWDLVSSVLILTGLEAIVVLIAFPAQAAVSTFAASALGSAGIAVATERDAYLWGTLAPLALRTPPLGYESLLFWLVGSVAATALVSRLTAIGSHVRYLIIVNGLLLAASAAYLLFAGHPGYDPSDYSRLYLRTATTVWIAIPVAVGAVTLMYPFTPLERAGLVTVCVAYDVAFSAVRYVVFSWSLATIGPVLMADLYIVFGTLLDFMMMVGVFAAFMVGLARRLSTETGVWSWL